VFYADERWTRTLIVIHCIANTAIGVSLLLWAELSAESVLTRFVPYWLWPCMFIGAGITAFFGLWSRVTAQFAFVFAGIITSAFGLASLYAVVAEHRLSAIPTTVFLLYIAVLKIDRARLIQQRDLFVQQVAEATEKGQAVLDKVTDGTNTR
jgi:hypothetical protein